MRSGRGARVALALVCSGACTEFRGVRPSNSDAAVDAREASAATDAGSEPVCESGSFRGVLARTAQLSVGDANPANSWNFHLKTAIRDATGGVLVAGGITGCSVAGRFDAAIVRLTPTFELDRSFGDGGRACVRRAVEGGIEYVAYALAVDSRGRIVVAGDTWTTESRNTGFIARFDERGQRDDSFGDRGYVDYHPGRRAGEPGFTVVLQSVLIDGDKIVVAGSDGHPFTRNRLGLLARFGDDGTPDVTFNEGQPVANRTVSGFYALAKSGGDYLVAGSTIGPTRPKVLRVDARGALVTAFGSGGQSEHASGVDINVRAMGVDATGRIYVGGGLSAEYSDFSSPAAVVRFSRDGAPDLAYGVDGAAIINASVWGFGYFFDRVMPVRCDGSLFIGARTGMASSVWKLDADGHLDTRFGANGAVRIDRPRTDLFGGISGLWLEPTGALRGLSAYSSNGHQSAFEIRP
jgi:uncharacterized delta-60 repeat protein